MQAIPGTLAGKENAVAEDSRALAAAGLALEASCAQVGRGGACCCLWRAWLHS